VTGFLAESRRMQELYAYGHALGLDVDEIGAVVAAWLAHYLSSPDLTNWAQIQHALTARAAGFDWRPPPAWAAGLVVAIAPTVPPELRPRWSHGGQIRPGAYEQQVLIEAVDNAIPCEALPPSMEPGLHDKWGTGPARWIMTLKPCCSMTLLLCDGCKGAFMTDNHTITAWKGPPGGPTTRIDHIHDPARSAIKNLEPL